jgi:hypothetical protein
MERAALDAAYNNGAVVGGDELPELRRQSET